LLVYKIHLLLLVYKILNSAPSPRTRARQGRLVFFHWSTTIFIKLSQLQSIHRPPKRSGEPFLFLFR